MPALAVFQLDDPDIAVEFDLAREIGVDVGLARLRPVEMGHPLTLELAGVEASRGGAEQPRRTVETIDLDEDGAGVVIAVADHDRRYARARAASEIGFGPDFGLETHS